MKSQLLHISNIVLILTLGLLLASVQNTLWFQFFGQLPAPLMWTLPIVYLSLNRSSIEAVLTIYLYCFILGAFTLAPVGILMFIGLVSFIICQNIRRRIYWIGKTYGASLCAVLAFALPVLHFIFSAVFEANPIHHPAIYNWMLQPLASYLAGYFFFPALSFIDLATHKEQLVEIG